MEYRITKKYYRHKGDGSVKSYFIIEYLGVSFFKSILFFKKWLKWKPYRVMGCYGIDCYKSIMEFNEEIKARRYLNNLRQPVHEDEPVL